MQRKPWQRVRKRLRYLMLSFPQPLIVRPADLRVPSPLSWKTGTRSRMNLTLQRNSECPAVPPRHPQAHGARWIPWEMAAVGIIYQQPWETGRSQLTGVTRCDTHLQEGLEAGCGELQACQYDLCDGQGYGGDYPSSHHKQCTGQPGDQAQPRRVYERQVLPD